MRHHNANRKFGKERKVRRAFLRSLMLNLILKRKITTTEPRAKELRSHVEKLVTLMKKGTPASDRLVRARLGTRLDLRARFAELRGAYAGRKGGYTRVIKKGPRKSDGSPMALIEFV